MTLEFWTVYLFCVFFVLLGGTIRAQNGLPKIPMGVELVMIHVVPAMTAVFAWIGASWTMVAALELAVLCFTGPRLLYWVVARFASSSRLWRHLRTTITYDETLEINV